MPALLKSKWRVIAFVSVCIVVATASLTFRWARAEKPLTTIVEIWQWNARNRPPKRVLLRATVTYYDPVWRILDVQTGDVGLFFDPELKKQDLRPGMLVDISGFSDPKSAITQVEIKPVSMAGLPAPVQTTIAEVVAGNNPGLLVSLKGVVRWAKTLDSRITLRVASGARAVNVRVMNASPDLLRVAPDSIIEVTGIASPPRQAGHSVGELFVSDTSSIKVLQAGNSDLFSLPLSDIEELSASGAPAENAHAIHVRQRIIEQSSDGDWVIGTASTQIHLRPLERMPAQPGDLVDAVGFPTVDGHELVLADAAVHLAARSGNRSRRILTNAGDVTALEPSVAAEAIPVRLNAFVTFFDPWWQLLFVQDHTGGIYVENVPPNEILRAGDVVQIEGETRSGGFIPDLAKPSINVSGHGPLPEAIKASNEDLIAGKYDSARVEVTGVVHGVTYNPDQKRMVLDVVSGSITIKAQVLTPDKVDDPKALIDCKLRMVGVAGTLMNQNMQMVGVALFVQDRSDITLLEQGPEDPFAIPASDINSLLRFRVPSRVQHRVHISGTVLMQDGDTLYVRDSSGVIAARLMEQISARPGDKVHVAGFIALGATRPILVQALAVLRGGAELARPQVHSAEEILNGSCDSDLVSVEGTVLSSTSSSLGWELLLQSESHTFNAIYRTDPVKQPLAKIEPGSVVRLTGVAEMQSNPNMLLPSALSFRIHLRDSNDLAILSTPPWWSLKRIFVIAGLFVFVVGVAIAWVVMLKRRVRQQTALIHQQTAGLLRAEKLASIGQLVAGVAHELNNPLTAVMGYSDLLMDDLSADHHRDRVKKLGREARRMKRIIDNLLHFARPKIAGREEVELESVIRGALSLQEYNLQCRGIKVDLLFQPELPKIELDEDQLKQVFLNLFNNAVQSLARSDEKRITVDAQIEGDRVVVRIADTGHGFEDVHRAFDPFYTTKPVGQGTGLGLSICYGIVKEHGGEISAHNLTPSGAVVVIKLPIAKDDHSTLEAAAFP